MNTFSDETANQFLAREWLSKRDTESGTVYLLKFLLFNDSCSIAITDTKTVWFESLSSNQFARRWRETYPLRSEPLGDSNEEDRWRKTRLKLLSAAHTIGNMNDLEFDIVPTRYSDFAFELTGEEFKWRWETDNIGHILAAGFLSKQLIMPLLSTVHLSFNSPGAVGEISDGALEATVDKVVQSGRRNLDLHLRNTLSKPRVSLTLRRITAGFNGASEIPKIYSDVDKEDIQLKDPDPVRPETFSGQRATKSPGVSDAQMGSPRNQSHNSDDWSQPGPANPGSALGDTGSNKQSAKDDSATENSEDEGARIIQMKEKDKAGSRLKPSELSAQEDSDKAREHKQVAKKSKVIPSSSDEDSAPIRPAKKPKKTSTVSSDDDSEDDSKRRGTSAGTSSKRGGARQPIKRGGRRF